MLADSDVLLPKKLIEVALPLNSINTACASEKSIRQGHPCSLHLWWARRPLAAARAVIFSQMVNDPSWKWEIENPGQVPPSQLKASWAASRKRLFSIIEDFVLWENTNNESILERARIEIRKSWRETCELNKKHPQAAKLFNPDELPSLHDPFAGGGAIPLEAQRLGVSAFASDLNPVSVVINKAMIDIPARFAGRRPVSLELKSVSQKKRSKASLPLELNWRGAQGLAEDVRFYGEWLRDEASKRIGHLYPTVEITKDLIEEQPELKTYLSKHLTVVAWIWARTVKSPNPAFSHVHVPLASSFVLSSKPGKESYVVPVVNGDEYRFIVKFGEPPPESFEGTKLSRGCKFRCILSNTAIPESHVKNEAIRGNMGVRLLAIVADGTKGRVYVSPTKAHEDCASQAGPKGEVLSSIHIPLANDPRNLWCLGYGLDHFDKLFTSRQLNTLSTLSELVGVVRTKIRADAVQAGLKDDDVSLNAGGCGATAYADAVAVYLGIAVDKAADYNSSICGWIAGGETLRNTFGRQAIPMVWDFCESNTLANASGSFESAVSQVSKALEVLDSKVPGQATQCDAQRVEVTNRVISTDPPYYDNISYADLSDFFYVWLRAALRPVFPDLFATLAVPKAEELIASPYRHGNNESAEEFFLTGMTQAMRQLAAQSHKAFPVTIYYAFKQSETETDGTSSTGWETFLDAVNRAGFSVTGTWPMRTERGARAVGIGTNALASSIVLVCRQRSPDAPTVSRREFIRELNRILPEAISQMTSESSDGYAPVAPVDLSQAIIGPGMAVFSSYSAVLEADGSSMTVRSALQLINRFLAEDDFDADTQFCLHWFEQYGWETGKFGEADTLARAKGTAVDGVKQSGILHSSGGNVRLLKWAEYPSDWDPQTDQRLPIWEVLHQLIRVFSVNGETGAAAVFSAVQSKAEAARQLAYRLYTLCERKNWAEDARAYNEVVTSWSGIESAAAREPAAIQRELFDN